MTLNPYQITWVEFRATTGIATKADCLKINVTDNRGLNKRAFYRHFPSKEQAIDFLTSFNKKLDKCYECRLFTDKQFGMRKEEEGYRIPFTENQLNEVYFI